MRRGGVLILLIGLILIVGAVALFLFLQSPGGGLSIGGGELPTSALPTEVPEVAIVRARVDIPANTVISDTNTLLEIVEIPQTEFDTEENFSSFSEIEGQLSTRPFRANQAIEKSALTDPGLSQQIPPAEANRPRDKGYPFIVNNLSGVSDQIKPGDFVDVVATFNVPRRDSYVTGQRVEEQAGQAVTVTERTVTDLFFNTTKTLVQRAQVIKIIRPSVPAEGEGTPVPDSAEASSSLPQVDASGQPIDPAVGAADTSGSVTQGSWTLILAVNDQEVELMEFALSTNSRMVLVLRGAGDTTYEPTIGTTLDLLVAEFGLPLPQSLPPHVFSVEDAFTPQPTRTPAPTRVP